ncbi:HAD family hydrolase [Nocardiopsis coralliicola]
MPHTSAAPAAIFFDLDDTLLDERTASSAGLRALMAQLGHPDFDAARSLWDVQTEISFGAYVDGRLTLAEQRRERVRALAVQAGHTAVSDADCDGLFDRYLAAHRSAWTAFADAVPALDALAGAGVALGVITNGVAELQHDKLDRLGLADRFPTVVCADTAEAGKPDRRIFAAACARAGVAPESAWHVGDHLDADALGAASAGLRAILLDRRGLHGQRSDLTVIAGLDRLPALLSEARGAAGGPPADGAAEPAGAGGATRAAR